MESLNILKVTELKQILKQAGVSTTGTKSDLIQRILQNGLVTATPSSLAAVPAVPQTQMQHPSLLQKPIVADLKEIDEDAILGGDGFDEKTADLALSNEDLLLDDLALNTNAAQASNAAKAPQVKQTIVKPVSAASNVPQVAAGIDQTRSTTITSKPLATTAEEKKQLRAIKFGDPKLHSRAERFGLNTVPLAISENKKILERANRFGQVVSEKAKTIEELARIEKRKSRFGEVTSAKTTTATSPTDLKKLQRAQRFNPLK